MSALGDRAADKLNAAVGSWAFVIGQAIFLGAWFTLNSVAWFYHWDNYPYVLANLFMSAEAAFTGPVILMASNRQGAIDSKTIQDDHATDTEALAILRELKEKFDGN